MVEILNAEEVKIESLADQKAYVRELAARVAEYAGTETNIKARQRWRDVNALRIPDRAPIWCKPCKCWEEILPASALKCSDPYLKGMEVFFRRALFKIEVGDDEPVRDCFVINAVFNCEPENIWGVVPAVHETSQDGGAWGYKPIINSREDLAKLKIPKFSYNAEKTESKAAQAKDLFDGIMPVVIETIWPLHSIIGNYVCAFRGMSEMMMDMMTDPELIHDLTAHFRDGVMASLDYMEKENLITPRIYGPMVECDPLAPDPEDGNYTFKHCYVMTNSQEYDQVSPDMWEEFGLNYQKPIIERFGLSAYGCCENLTHKIDGILTIKNLRMFVCSAWTDLDVVLNKVPDDKVIMWRQKSSEVVFADSLKPIRQHLEEGTKKLQGRKYQIVMRELETLNGHSDRLHRWTEIAKEMACKYA